MKKKKIRIPLLNGFELEAEANADSGYPFEIFICVCDSDGVWHQDLAVVRAAPESDGKTFEVLVYADKDDEDYCDLGIED